MSGAFEPLEAGDPVVVGPYRLTAKLGAGGMGAVYLSHTAGGHSVAIKTVRPELAENAEFRRRFRQEVEAARRVQGFYTAPVLDHDVDSGQPWLATAYVAGPSLAEAVGRHGPLPVPSVLLLLAGVAEALSAIHGADVIHRDLKPSNVLLAADGPRVIDFGIARASDATSLTGTGVSPGTPAFMSPEQAAGKRVTPASDVFSLGQVGVFAATGRGAYGDGSAHALLYRIVHETPDLTGLPAELAFIARCLAKDPAQRPTPAEVIALCQGASATPLRQSGDWLPAAVGADIPLRTPGNAGPVEPQRVATHVETPGVAGQLGTPGVAGSLGSPGIAGPVGAPTPQPPTHPAYSPPQHPYTPTHFAPTTPPHPAPAWHPPHPRPRRTKTFLALGAVLVPLAIWGSNLMADDGDNSAGNTPDPKVSASPRASAAPPTPHTYKNIDIPIDYFIRFGDTPPKPMNNGGSTRNTEESDFYFFQGNDDELIGSVGSKVVVLDAQQQGTLQTCRTDTRFTRELGLSQVPTGTRLCVHSSAGNIALITYRGNSPASDPSRYITVDVTVWRNAEG
ncbi:serine/threonine-protein kinase [Streptomyces acidiscabies]|uniref:Protein kinase n=1 Tax=Streptomyces acidiscabies TaxID=42234 RepID=A0AAP6EDV7_9ACTN|nr:serine/threonine-protein kinase [Streptomyces acidiscabies]MBZ3911026.1 protein kinase [Streptomyces acidiscabies]MDX2959193.1 protein kinase [Streptomyces acidiscabies]MDX3017663.1 protein kinase [Streptomyces acidiscabies]MDX3788138.1 protein kinase [Streptomyces acidiscabies]